MKSAAAAVMAVLLAALAPGLDCYAALGGAYESRGAGERPRTEGSARLPEIPRLYSPLLRAPAIPRGIQDAPRASPGASLAPPKAPAAEVLRATEDKLVRAEDDAGRRRAIDEAYIKSIPFVQSAVPEEPSMMPYADRSSGLSKPGARGKTSRALKLSGASILAVSSLSLLGVAVKGAVPLVGAGFALLGAAKFLQKPEGGGGETVPAKPISAALPAWVLRQIPSLARMADRADAMMLAEARFDGKVGAGSAAAFKTWLAGGLRAAVYSLPLVLLGMLAATLVSGVLSGSPLQTITTGLNVGNTEAGRWLVTRPWFGLLSSYLASTVLQQAALIGGVFAGTRALLRRFGSGQGKASWAAAALTLAAAVPALLAQGYTLALAWPLLGIEAGLLYAYARSRTLLVPLGFTAIFWTIALYSTRMLALIPSKTLGSFSSLHDIPALQGVLAGVATSAGLFALMAAARHWKASRWGFLKQEALHQWRRLKSLGRWWNAPQADEAPKSPAPILSAGSLWGIGVYLGEYLSYWTTHAIVPTHEVTPEILKRTLMMPFDLLGFIFLGGAALEEWIFRAGLFDWLSNRSLFGRKVGDVPAAILSSIGFSAFHFVPFAALLGHFNVHVPAGLEVLLGVYSFSWAGFIDRAAAGLLLTFLYRRSRTLAIGIMAHFTANMLEAVGLRWGLSWSLAAVAAIFLLQIPFRWKNKKS